MVVIRAGIHQANREDSDQTKKQSDLGLHSLARTFWQATSV